MQVNQTYSCGVMKCKAHSLTCTIILLINQATELYSCGLNCVSPSSHGEALIPSVIFGDVAFGRQLRLNEGGPYNGISAVLMRHQRTRSTSLHLCPQRRGHVSTQRDSGHL